MAHWVYIFPWANKSNNTKLKPNLYKSPKRCIETKKKQLKKEVRGKKTEILKERVDRYNYFRYIVKVGKNVYFYSKEMVLIKLDSY